MHIFEYYTRRAPGEQHKHQATRARRARGDHARAVPRTYPPVPRERGDARRSRQHRRAGGSEGLTVNEGSSKTFKTASAELLVIKQTTHHA
eukprot:COSAG02_NODE_281_length_25776_cov_37.797998_13_plen_91_part_00